MSGNNRWSPALLDEAVHQRLLAAAPPEERIASHTVAALVRSIDPLLPGAEVQAATERVLSRVGGLGPLDPLLADPEVTEVMINGPGPVWVERRGRLERTTVVLAVPVIEHLIERIVGPLGLRVDPSTPMADARLPDGSRVNAVVAPLAIDGPCLTIRRFRVRSVELEELATPAVAALLVWLVRSRANIVVSGGTGAGKTTLLNALAASIEPDERVVTIEDAAELRLPGGHVVRLEARPASPEGHPAVTIRQLVRNALRMRPDRILVGEVRGPEAFDLLQAMNTGHDGSLSTCHANSPDDALRRLETMVLLAEAGLPLDAVREQLGSAVDIIVQVGRRPDGRRAVVAVNEVVTGRGSSGGGGRTQLLADEGRVRARPTRPVRSSEMLAPSRAFVLS